METKEILKFCLEKGFLLDKDILALFSESNDVETSKRLIEDIGQQTQKKIITKKIWLEMCFGFRNNLFCLSLGGFINFAFCRGYEIASYIL